MYNHFVCQFSDTKFMDVNKKIQKKQLNSIDKQHNFIILRSLYDWNYETEIHRSIVQ